MSRACVVRAWVCVAVLALASAPASAVQLGNPDDVLSIEIHAFGSQGFMVSTANNYLADSHHGSFEFTEVGLNFTKQLTSKLRTGFQLFTHKLGPTGNFDIKADWFYLDYRWKDWLGFRAGRTKLPFGLYNDSSDIDAARVPILLPQSVYPAANRDYLLAQTGGEIYGYISMRKAGALEYRLYGGTIFLDIAQTPGIVQILDLKVPYLAGARLMWETPLDGLRVGGSFQTLRIDTKLNISPSVAGPGGVVDVEIPAYLWVASIEYSAHRLLLAAEYSRWHLGVNSSNPTLVPEKPSTQERSYVMASYRVNRWFQPGLYYSAYLPDAYKRTGRESVQHDAAASLRFDVNSFWIIKLEGHFMAGTAALVPAQNDNVPLNLLDRYWGFFLIKTTAYF